MRHPRLTRRAALLGIAAAALPLRAAGQEASDPADAADEALLAGLAAPWTGDLDGVLARGFLRVGVAYGPLFFLADGPNSSGLTVDIMAEFEKHLRATLGAPARHLTLVLAPLPRDRLFPALEGGQVDLLAANLTITPDRLARAAFTDPLATGVRELVVTGPESPPVATPDDLHAIELHVRASSSYHEHLLALDAARRAAGAPPLRLVAADENLEDEDLMELVALGVIDATVMDEHKARLFGQVFPQATVRDDLAVAEGGAIGWALRRDAPALLAAANGFVKTAKKGTTLGNILIKRHYGDAERVRDAMDPDGRSRFEEAIGFIRAHAAAYEFDALMIAAQGYQESRLDQKARSAAGAVGIMQVLPSTARDPAVGIPDIDEPARNVEAGVKYLRLLRDQYLDDPAISPRDQTLMAFAAYNAGPGNLNKARRRAAKSGLDPNVWFGNVEVAMAQAVSREPVVYVRNILKYYVTYRLAEDRKARGG